MKISCAVFDLDGTLLTPQNTISETDLKTLRDLSREGVRIVIATGRSELQIREYVHLLGISDPVITCNGGVILNPSTREILHRKFIRDIDAKAMVDAFEKMGADYLMYTPDIVYHSENSERIKFFFEYNKKVKEEFRVPIKSMSQYPKDAEYKNVIKLLLLGDRRDIPHLYEKFGNDNNLTIVCSGRDRGGLDLLDIMPEDTTKGSGIEILAQKLNIPVSEVVAFGDSDNDESMLRAAGFSVAMGNADDYIKEISDFVTKKNDECGITYALSHIAKL